MVQLDDLGLTASKGGNDEQVLGSRSTYIVPAVERDADEAAAAAHIPLRKVSVYLINNVVRLPANARPEKTIHYAIGAGISSLDDTVLKDDQIAVNQWTAEQLGAKVGDEIRLDYYQRQSNGELREVRGEHSFTVARIIPMQGLGADRTLTPAYKGLTDADRFRSWQAPQGLTIRRELVTDEDETYWRQYKAAPKLFLSLAAANRLWGGEYGRINSIRYALAHAESFQRELLNRIDPAQVGLSFRAIKAEQLAAASGSTDFSMLFIGFSFFLIVSAALLVAMLLRLNIEQRSRQFGLLAAVGFTGRSLTRLALAEGAVLASLGSAMGLALGLLYTWLMLAALRSPTWWRGAVGTSALSLYADPLTLIIAFISSVVVAMLAVIWAVRRLRRSQAATLLAGGWQRDVRLAHSRGRASQTVGIGCLIGGIVLLAGSRFLRISEQIAFLGGGALLLVGCLSLLAYRLAPVRHASASLSLPALAFRNASRSRSRSLAAICLVALASFLLVTVSSMKQRPPADTHDRASGTAGYQLMIRADVPLLGNLNTDEGRRLLGISDEKLKDPIWQRIHFTNVRVFAGQDASCLNITRPTSPTILGIPAELEAAIGANRSASFAAQVPIIADAESATYILKLSIGQTLKAADEFGRPVDLELVATIPHSMFQSELLMLDGDFRRLFPSQSGFGMVLVRAGDADAAKLAEWLPRQLKDFSVSVETTASRLAQYQAVANTYLSTFQMLGSLGLLLGTIGLAAMLLRTLAERRGEMALLAAIGFARARRLGLVLTENAMLLIVGLLVGVACALVGVVPTIIASARSINWSALAATLAGVLVVGLLSLTIALWAASRHITSADLRGMMSAEASAPAPDLSGR